MFWCLPVHQVSMKHPSAVTACNLDLENLITDSNRSIATLAITTLLKTGSESSVDRLMKQISSFVSEISDEFKVSRICLHFSVCLLWKNVALHRTYEYKMHLKTHFQKKGNTDF